MVHSEIRLLFLVPVFNHTPSAVIQRGGRVGVSSVPHGSNCATIAYHVGLIAESNCSVEGLQLRLEDMSIF